MVTLRMKTLFVFILLLNIIASGYLQYSRPVSWQIYNPVSAPNKPPILPRFCLWQNQWIDCSLTGTRRVNTRENVGSNPKTWTLIKYPFNGLNNQDVGSGSNVQTRSFDPYKKNSKHQQLNDEIFAIFNKMNKTSESFVNLNTENGVKLNDTKNKSCNGSHNAINEVNYHSYGHSINNNKVEISYLENNCTLCLFKKALNHLQRSIHMSTFKRLSAISPAERRENGVSFTHSCIFLLLHLIAVADEVDSPAKAEIKTFFGFETPYPKNLNIINEVMSLLPSKTNELRLSWVSRLIVEPEIKLSDTFRNDIAPALRVHITKLFGNESVENLTNDFNKLVDKDSSGAMRDGFDEDELTDGLRAIMLMTMCLRPTWHSPPTLLNGTWPFYDVPEAPQRLARMIKINDIIGYADLKDFNAEAVEIKYATPGLSILIIIPRGHSLRQLVEKLAASDIEEITDRMQTTRIAVSLPVFTLRMTLLLPNKLEDIGIANLLKWNETSAEALRLSHGVQRLMFWSEPGRHAFKDDGIEWDEKPEKEITVNRPYVFYVRWNNLTLINGNFVL